MFIIHTIPMFLYNTKFAFLYIEVGGRRTRRGRGAHGTRSSCMLVVLLATSSLIFGPLATPRVSVIMGRKPGVMEPEDLEKFVAAAGEKLIVVDARNPDFQVEPGDGKSNEKAPLAACGAGRKRAVNILYDRSSNSMDLSKIPESWIAEGGGLLSVPVITHCGGGGRGQKAKEYLEANGFGNVANGGKADRTQALPQPSP